MLSRRTFLKGACGGALLPILGSCQDVDAELELKNPWPILPYIQNVTTQGATILWESIGETGGKVEIYQDSTLINVFEGQKEKFHKISLSGLNADTGYFYIVKEGNTRVGPTRSFRTAPLRGSTQPFSFLVVGDGGTASKQQFKVADQMAGYFPAFVVHVGDVVYDGYEGEYPSKFFSPYRALTYRAPFYPVLGDHDLVDEARAFFKFFDLPKNNIEFTSDFYAFEYANALFVALNTNRMIVGDNLSQLTFLEQQLQQSTHTWKFIVLHHTLFTSAEGRGSSEQLRNDIGRLAELYGVAIVFSGDVHSYERFFPRKDYFPESATPGVTYVVTGGGGAELRELSTRGQSVGAVTYQFTHIAITGSTLVLSAIDLNGQSIDNVTLTR